MVAIAQSLALPEVLQTIVTGIAGCQNVVLTRIWLFGPGDLCATCRFADDCHERERCLHLVASAGNSLVPGVEPGNLHGAFRRFPIGHRKIGRIAATGEPMFAPDLLGDEAWLVEPVWATQEGVKAFAAQPLVFRGEVLGVLALFDRKRLGAEDIRWLRVFADHAAVSIANARAFEEIDLLRARLQAENGYLQEEIVRTRGGAQLIGDSPAMHKVTQQVQIVASTNATVLITGESGTGKEVVARAIHEQSGRRDRPMIRVNCGAVTESLFESEFFGHVRGAFTGAMKDRLGRFELADGGTLFLDEIGEVPLSMQAKLLRVLQEQEFERVGDTRTRKVDVRVIAATNRDLRAEVDAGRFRQDLFYRLSVFPIELPALRERRGDIAALANHFLGLSGARRGAREVRLSQVALHQLERHDWPGNVRELQNAIERALILVPSGPLRFEGLAAGSAGAAPPRAAVALPAAAVVQTRQQLREQERANLLAALATSGGKVFGPGGAAELLGMKPTTLASRLKALGIVRPRLGS